MNKLFFTIIAFILMSAPMAFAQNKETKTLPANYSITKNEMQLFETINVFRAKHNLGELQLSPSLSFVARTHLNDIRLNSKDEHGCNLNSWSDKGKWIPCCFNEKHNNLDLMTSKPSEITGFRGKGYEIVIVAKKGVYNKDLVALWLSAKSTQDFILNKGECSDQNWQCMGVSIYNGFASIWASEMPDRMTNVAFLKEVNQKPVEQQPATKLPTAVKIDEVKPKAKTDPTTEKVNSAQDKGTNYFLVHSSYTALPDAMKAFKTLKKDGFKNLIMMDARGKYRIALGIFKTEAAAKKAQLQYSPRFDHLMIYIF